MYSVSGITYRIIAVGGMMLLLSVGLFVLGTFVTAGEKHSYRLWGTVTLVFAFLYCSYFGYKALKPTVEIHEGYLEKEYRDSRVAPPLPFTHAYVFTNNGDVMPRYYLDTFSKKEILGEELISGVLYRVYYEKDTRIILKVEICEGQGI